MMILTTAAEARSVPDQNMDLLRQTTACFADCSLAVKVEPAGPEKGVLAACGCMKEAVAKLHESIDETGRSAHGRQRAQTIRGGCAELLSIPLAGTPVWKSGPAPRLAQALQECDRTLRQDHRDSIAATIGSFGSGFGRAEKNRVTHEILSNTAENAVVEMAKSRVQNKALAENLDDRHQETNTRIANIGHEINHQTLEQRNAINGVRAEIERLSQATNHNLNSVATSMLQLENAINGLALGPTINPPAAPDAIKRQIDPEANLAGVTDGESIHYGILILPDPRVPSLRRGYENALEAVKAAMFDAGYDFDRYGFPWQEYVDTNLEQRRTETAALLDDGTFGVLLFRKGNRDNFVENKPLWRALYTVLETNSFGVQRRSLERAWARALVEQQGFVEPIAPQFVGSIRVVESVKRSLHTQINERPTRILLALPGSSRDDIVSLTKRRSSLALHAQIERVRMLAQNDSKNSAIPLLSALRASETLRQFEQLLVCHPARCSGVLESLRAESLQEMPIEIRDEIEGQVKHLSSFVGAYKAEWLPAVWPNGLEADLVDERRQESAERLALACAGGGTCILLGEQTANGGIYAAATKMEIYVAPSNMGELRDAARKRRNGDGVPPQLKPLRTLALLEIDEGRENGTEYPDQRLSTINATAAERQLVALETKLREKPPQRIVIAMDDIRDRLFLMERLNRFLPTTELVDVQPDVLLAHPTVVHATRGVRSIGWDLDLTGRPVVRAFPNEAALRLYWEMERWLKRDDEVSRSSFESETKLVPKYVGRSGLQGIRSKFVGWPMVILGFACFAILLTHVAALQGFDLGLIHYAPPAPNPSALIPNQLPRLSSVLLALFCVDIAMWFASERSFKSLSNFARNATSMEFLTLALQVTALALMILFLYRLVALNRSASWLRMLSQSTELRTPPDWSLVTADPVPMLRTPIFASSLFVNRIVACLPLDATTGPRSFNAETSSTELIRPLLLGYTDTRLNRERLRIVGCRLIMACTRSLAGAMVCAFAVLGLCWAVPLIASDVYVLLSLSVIVLSAALLLRLSIGLERDGFVSRLLCNTTEKFESSTALWAVLLTPLLVVALSIAIAEAPGVLSWSGGLFAPLWDWFFNSK